MTDEFTTNPATDTETGLSFRLASYNIRKGLGTDRKRDPHRILRVISELGADVVALQEADLRLPPRRPIFDSGDIFARTGLVPVGFAHGRESLGWHGNALLVSPGFKVVSQSFQDLPGLEPRGLVSAVLERDGRRVRIIGVHLGLWRHSRRQQLSAILETISQNLDPTEELPTLIAGDFNERSLAVGLGRLSRRFTILSGGPTYHSRHPVFALDRIAVTNQFSRVQTHVFRSFEASRASDHLPLLADLTL